MSNVPGGVSAMASESRQGRDEGSGRPDVRRPGDTERPRIGGEADEEAPRPLLEPEPGVELNVGEDPGGVPDPEWK